MPKQNRVNYALAATLLASGIHPDEIAPKVGAKNSNVLMVGLCKRGVNARNAKNPGLGTNVSLSLVHRVASQASDLLRKDFADILQSHTSELKKIAPRPSLRHLRAVGDALEPLARTAKIVHDWGNTEAQGMILVGDVASAEAQETTIDIPSTQPVVVSEPIPEQKQIG